MGAVTGLLALFMMSGNTSYMSVIASYSLLIVGTSLLFGYTLHNLYNINKNGIKEGLVKILFIYVVPFILMVLNLGYLLYLITANNSIVKSGNLNNDYSIFSKIFIILTIIQTSMLYYSINTSKNGKIMNPVYNSLIVLISIINFYIIRIIKIVIVDYPVDCITCPLPPQPQPSSTTSSSSTSSSSSSPTTSTSS